MLTEGEWRHTNAYISRAGGSPNIEWERGPMLRHYDFTDADGERPDWGAVDLEARRETLTSGMPDPA